MINVPVVVMTSDKYLPTLRPFAYLFNKYWGATQWVEIVGFAKPEFPLPANFHFVSLGDQVHYPVNKWSDALIDYLALRPEMHHFVLMLEDYWLTRPVNTQAVRMLYDYAVQFRNVLKIDLLTDRLYAANMRDYNHCGYLDLIKSDYQSPYHMSLMTGIWSRDLLLRFLIRGETPWDVEIHGTPRVAAAKDEVLVLGTRQSPVRNILAHRNGDSGKTLLDGLQTCDIDALRALQYLQEST